MITKATVPVLIVGGGGAGLSASMIVSTYGVESLLVSALPSTSVPPKAHVLGQRTMEIYTEVGIAEEIYRRGTPPGQPRAHRLLCRATGQQPERRALDREARDLGCGLP